MFSDPAKSQQEALSYLLRGQGLGSSGADGNAMTSMLIGMGVAQSGQLVGKIGEAFGVSNLALDTQGVGDSSQVVVSGYVLPGLQVKYGVGIFDSLATLTLRYRLMPKLYLEAVSGLDQALDDLRGINGITLVVPQTVFDKSDQIVVDPVNGDFSVFTFHFLFKDLTIFRFLGH